MHGILQGLNEKKAIFFYLLHVPSVLKNIEKIMQQKCITKYRHKAHKAFHHRPSSWQSITSI